MCSSDLDFLIRGALSTVLSILPNAIIANRATLLRTTPQTLKFSQTHCRLCSRYFCKGAALTNYRQIQGPFGQVVFGCNGANDLCPAFPLPARRLLFLRKGFALEQAILALDRLDDVGGEEVTSQADSEPNRNKEAGIKARVMPFKTGKFVRQLVVVHSRLVLRHFSLVC